VFSRKQRFDVQLFYSKNFSLWNANRTSHAYPFMHLAPTVVHGTRVSPSCRSNILLQRWLNVLMTRMYRTGAYSISGKRHRQPQCWGAYTNACCPCTAETSVSTSAALHGATENQYFFQAMGKQRHQPECTTRSNLTQKTSAFGSLKVKCKLGRAAITNLHFQW